MSSGYGLPRAGCWVQTSPGGMHLILDIRNGGGLCVPPGVCCLWGAGFEVTFCYLDRERGRPTLQVMRALQASEVRDWVDQQLLSPDRTRPIIGVSKDTSTDRFLVEPDKIEARLGEWVDVVAFDTSEATWELAEVLPDRLEVYGGAVRIWWPELTPASDPYGHRLFLARSTLDEARVIANLEQELRQWGDQHRGGAAGFETVTATVIATGEELQVESADGVIGVVTEADLPVAALAVCATDGLALEVEWPAGWKPEAGPAQCSMVGRVPSPWELLGATLHPGDICMARVAEVRERFALLELLPTARGVVRLADVDHTYVENIEDFLTANELVPVQVVQLDPISGRAQLSVKGAQGSGVPPLPLPSLLPGGVPFDWRAYLARKGVGFIETREEDSGRVQELEDSLAHADQDRSALRQAAGELRMENKRLKARLAELEAREDPFADARTFLREVRVAYARMIDEGERSERPLARMRVGSEFLERARGLQGIPPEKIVEVCAQVACGRAHELESREVHPLHEHGAGTDAKVRESDGARAWRCALQVGTPSARRLHWWRIPGEHGGAIEFASVAVHDDYSLPE